MEKANQELRNYAKKRGVAFWEIGYELGVSEQAIIRWMRTPLNEEKEARIKSAVDKILERKIADLNKEV